MQRQIYLELEKNRYASGELTQRSLGKSSKENNTLLPGSSIYFKQHLNERGHIACPPEIWKSLSAECKTKIKQHNADKFLDKNSRNPTET